MIDHSTVSIGSRVGQTFNQGDPEDYAGGEQIFGHRKICIDSWPPGREAPPIRCVPTNPRTPATGGAAGRGLDAPTRSFARPDVRMEPEPTGHTLIRPPGRPNETRTDPRTPSFARPDVRMSREDDSEWSLTVADPRPTQRTTAGARRTQRHSRRCSDSLVGQSCPPATGCDRGQRGRTSPGGRRLNASGGQKRVRASQQECASPVTMARQLRDREAKSVGPRLPPKTGPDRCLSAHPPVGPICAIRRSRSPPTETGLAAGRV
jgi:hypothetical protein